MNLTPPLTIQKLVYPGWGLTENQGYKIFAPQTLPGDQVSLQLYQKKKTYAMGKTVQTHVLSPYRNTPTCPHYMQCGGCQLQDVDYPSQLQLKQNMLKESLSKSHPHLLPILSEIIPCSLTQFYRNKMEFSFGYSTDKQLILGLKKRGQFDQIEPISNCILQSELSNQIIAFTTQFFRQTPLSPWDYHQNKGDLKFLVIKESKTHHTCMLNLVATTPDTRTYLAYANTIKQAFPQISSIFYSLNRRGSDAVEKNQPTLLLGQDTLTETLDGLSFSISPHSFFQTNTHQTLLLYTTILNAIPHQQNTLLDLYCGTGTIGLFVSKKVKKIIGIEEIPAAIQDAQQNAQLNHIHHAEFICGDVRKILKNTLFSPDVIIVDPPRPGIVPKALKRIAEQKAPLLIYVSCNPSTLLRDLSTFSEFGYAPSSLQPIDMFPHTFHIETVATLSLQY